MCENNNLLRSGPAEEEEEEKKIPQSYSRSKIASNVQDGAFVKMFNMVLWIYIGVGICQGSEFGSDTQGSEYAWVCSSIMLEYVWICPKQNLK